MKICDNIKKPKNEFVKGRLYKCDQSEFTKVCIAVSDFILVVLECGTLMERPQSLNYDDVTDQYCLQKIK